MFLIGNPCVVLVVVLFQNVFGESREEAEKGLKLILGYPLDAVSNFTEMAIEHGYEAEQHLVTTEDGYILTMFRISKGKNCKEPIRKPPVLLMHGLLMSSDSFMDSGPDAGLAYLISDLCYDLWAPNIRGNYYSKQHIKLNPSKDREFWDFSNFEFGYYDIPASLNYILSYTKSDKINYIGYSQGGSTFFIMNSERPEYNDKIGVGILLEPGSKHTYTRSQLFRWLGDTYQLALPTLYQAGLYEALPLGGFVQEAASFLCKDYALADFACKVALGLIDSFHPGSIKTETVRVLFGHFPAGTSVKNMAWYGQALNVDEFQNFDYGATGNLQQYGTSQPPVFNLSLVEVPVVVIHGRHDYLTSPADVEWVTSKLPNVLEQFYVEDPMWNHFDITYSQFTGRSILGKIKEYLDEFST
ncbi:Lipase 1 [Papilio xuthus]|uniref:Lipase n=2 Tax=Papilio xuthus TaxID=66420 RepID=A0A194QC12_PAPXU|nr:Lipase 1 [Papilio xuthus]